MTASMASRIGVALLLLASWAAGGCARKPTQPARPARPTAVRAPKEVVQAYLEALEEGNYRAAYEELTSKSRSMHSFDAFRRAAEQGGPVYDLDRMEVESLSADEVQVSVGIAEDPAVQSFVLEREDRQWRIVFHSGSPAAPNAD